MNNLTQEIQTQTQHFKTLITDYCRFESVAAQNRMMRNGPLSLRCNYERLPPIHPGEILQEEFLEPMGIRQSRLAKEIGVPALRIYEIVRGERGISGDTAVRLGRYFGISAEF